ncbi:MAG: tRNA 2-thiouridine(34) synthase MnmA [Oscillospiraceae bacterium]|jgi:tRNA-specific 2-thiouridylase|nr:tRNA 2-thiouridine(34) synthase MnmA [Oscillospiraceae bacterium]
MTCDESARILVAMSGGVDSTAAASLLLERGHACAGAHLSLFEGAGEAESARAAAARLGIPLHVFDMREQFERAVIARFVESYLRGQTPNPCVDCNRRIKFGALLEKASQLGYPAIATGHYARLEFSNGRWLLRKAADESKDQSYVLYTLTQGQLARVHFPLGEMTKAQVREYALSKNFPNARKGESQDICFVPDGDYAAFLERHTGQPLRPGDFIDPRGRVLGRHRGTACYTLGQRKGLGLALPQPGYVCGIDPASNTVTVGEETLLFGKTLHARDVNLIARDALAQPLRCKAKIRYRQAEQWATAEQVDADTLRVNFDEPQRAITPGQAVVLYDGAYVVGGGTIRDEQ